MSKKPYPVFCRDCKYSQEEVNGFSLNCTHPKINARNSWSLSSKKEYAGVGCREEREKGWFAACGVKGKLWHMK